MYEGFHFNNGCPCTNVVTLKSITRREKPITSIFFGGGTPSILLPKHILRIGNAIKDNFDLSSLKEFSFEMNAKTVLPERVAAMREVGVTHGRMGVQTFNPEYRDMFKLSATLENIYYGAELLNKTFDYVCIDMLYGMHGQTAEDIIKDLRQARQLGTSHMDVYPINNGVIQKRLKEEYDKRNFKATSALNKYLFNVLIYDYLHSNEFVPHNGHGYYRSQSVANINGFVDNGVFIYSIGEVITIPQLDIQIDRFAPNELKSEYFSLAELRTLGFVLGPILMSAILKNCTAAFSCLINVVILLFAILINTITQKRYMQTQRREEKVQ